jgi:uncharacterized membrane protein
MQKEHATGVSLNNANTNAELVPLLPMVRHVPAMRVLGWITAGAIDTWRGGFASVFYGLCFAIAGWVMLMVFAEAFALFAGLTTGFLLLGPFLAMGLYDISRQMQIGEAPKLRPSLSVWRVNKGNIALFAGVLLVILLIWSRASIVIFALFFEGGLPTFKEVIFDVIALKQPMFTLVYFSVGGFFAAFVFVVSVVAVPLMADRKTDAVTAGLTSIMACTKNPIAMLLWAFFIVLLVAIGFVTSFAGLIITMPIVGHASWHVYQDLVIEV